MAAHVMYNDICEPSCPAQPPSNVSASLFELSFSYAGMHQSNKALVDYGSYPAS